MIFFFSDKLNYIMYQEIIYNKFNNKFEKEIDKAKLLLLDVRNSVMYNPKIKCIKIPVKIYYEDLFMEILTLSCWLNIKHIEYEKNIFLLENDILLKFEIDSSNPVSYNLILKCPINNIIIIEHPVLAYDSLIVEKLHYLVNMLNDYSSYFY